jgi:hypothetical protein
MVKARGVIQDQESYERTKTAIGFLKLLVQAEENIRSAKMYDQVRCLTESFKNLTSQS